jgi:hypothetical protein
MQHRGTRCDDEAQPLGRKPDQAEQDGPAQGALFQEMEIIEDEDAIPGQIPGQVRAEDVDAGGIVLGADFAFRGPIRQGRAGKGGYRIRQAGGDAGQEAGGVAILVVDRIPSGKQVIQARHQLGRNRGLALPCLRLDQNERPVSDLADESPDQLFAKEVAAGIMGRGPEFF